MATFLPQKVLAPIKRTSLRAGKMAQRLKRHLSTHISQSRPMSFGLPPMIISFLPYDQFLAFALSSHECTNGLYYLLSKPLHFIFLDKVWKIHTLSTGDDQVHYIKSNIAPHLQSYIFQHLTKKKVFWSTPVSEPGKVVLISENLHLPVPCA